MERSISAIAVPDYNPALLKQAVVRHFDALELWPLLQPGLRVVLKPNLLMRRAPEAFTTTHPAVVEAVAAVLRERGVHDIVLADSPGGPYTKPLLESIYNSTGMTAASKHAQFRLNTDLSWEDRAAVPGALCKSFSVLTPILHADLVINLPKLKTHAMTTLSGGVKNLFGCVPGLQKPELHFRFPQEAQFCQMLCELALLVAPAITLVDAVVSMQGDGPSGGDRVATGMTFCARNIHALDLGLCFYTGLPLERVATVRYAVEAGLCPSSPDALLWLGDGIPEPVPFVPPRTSSLTFTSNVPAFLRPAALWLEHRYLSPRPVVRKRDCIGCGKCAESCAPHAMTLHEGKAELQLNACIRCYCCHEMCPVKAIDIRRRRFLGL